MKQCRVLCVPSVFCRHSTRESKVSKLLIICVISFLLLFSSRFINPTKPREEETTSAELEQFYFLEGEIKACFEWIGVFPLHRVSFIQTKADNFIVAYRKKQETIEWRSSQVRRRRRLKRVMWYVLCSRWWRNVINIEPNLVLEVKSSNRYTYKALCTILKESLANKSKNNNNERSRQFWVFHSCDLCAFCCALTNKNIQLIECHRKIITQIDSRKSFIASAIIIHPSIRRWVAAQEEEKRDP